MRPTTLEQPRVEGSLSVAPADRRSTLPHSPHPTPMYSIRFRIPLPAPDAGTGGFVRFLLAIRDLAVGRFGGAMRACRDGRRSDGGPPPEPVVTVTLSFDDSVHPLEVTRALDDLYERAEAIARGPDERE